MERHELRDLGPPDPGRREDQGALDASMGAPTEQRQEVRDDRSPPLTFTGQAGVFSSFPQVLALPPGATIHRNDDGVVVVVMPGQPVPTGVAPAFVGHSVQNLEPAPHSIIFDHGIATKCFTQ